MLRALPIAQRADTRLAVGRGIEPVELGSVFGVGAPLAGRLGMSGNTACISG